MVGKSCICCGKLVVAPRRKYCSDKCCTTYSTWQWTEHNKDKHRAYRRQYYAQNKHRLRQNTKEWLDENREHMREYMREYRKKHRAEIAAYQKKYSAEYRAKKAQEIANKTSEGA